MNINRLMAAAGAVALAVAAGACGGTSKSTSPTSTGGSGGGSSQSSSGGSGGTVAFIPGATGVGFYQTMEQGAKQEASKLGMKFIYQGAPQFSPSAQVPVVNAVCSEHPKILLVAPTDPVALRPAIQTCINDGIAVVTVDTQLQNTQGIVSQISSDNIQGGEAAASAIASHLGGKGEVAVMSLSPTATTQVQRVDGLKKGLAKYPGIKIVSSQYTGQAQTASETDARAILSAHPNVKAFFGAGEPNGEGASSAVAQAGDKGKVFIVTYDADPSEVSLLKSGAIGALVIQPPAQEGQLAVEYGHDYITGNKSAIKSSVLLPNQLVTSSQASSPSVQKYYYTGS